VVDLQCTTLAMKMVISQLGKVMNLLQSKKIGHKDMNRFFFWRITCNPPARECTRLPNLFLTMCFFLIVVH